MAGSRKQEPRVKQAETTVTGTDDAPQEPRAATTPDLHGVRSRRSIWDDSMVRMMGFAAAILVIVFLATIVGALYFGFLGNNAPQTSSEREVMAWESAARTKGAGR